ncbi:PRD domain-containing protein [Periweissella fabalis]|uniref:PRD domain-containing protein n=1 Tax=Periweissella fabalis TaxID=1070421 RepID=A0A7X6N3Y5_9LACO|nr:PRD domain-containing protein [Periweissella fabalis]MCM0599161.1 PRD domain-containing protein [Periweissella fabalis]NKZ23440.1 PRD domain-containing protein [Periweissella fabalis]
MVIQEEAQRIIDNSLSREELLIAIKFVEQCMAEKNIHATDLQWTILINHLDEMIKRQKEHTTIPHVDQVMFSEISAEALDIADKVVNHIGGLSEDEKYVLSIHFENAKLN